MGRWKTDHNKQTKQVYLWLHGEDGKLQGQLTLDAGAAADLALALKEEVVSCLGLSPDTTTNSAPDGWSKQETPLEPPSTDLGQLASPSCCSPGNCTCGEPGQ